MKVIGYMRVSTDEQTQSGLGMEAQQYAIQDYANKIGSPVNEIYKDEGLSGSLPMSKRPGLFEAIEKLKKGDVLLVAKRDRLSRDTKLLMMIEIEINKRKAKILSAAGEGTENDDSGSILFRGMIDQFAQFERLRIGERTKAALQAKKLKKERVGYIPYGFQLAEDNKHLIPNEEEQQIIGEMQKLKQHGLGVRKIADNLNSRNIMTRNSSAWKHMAIHRIMQGINSHKCLLS